MLIFVIRENKIFISVIRDPQFFLFVNSDRDLLYDPLYMYRGYLGISWKKASQSKFYCTKDNYINSLDMGKHQQYFFISMKKPSGKTQGNRR